MKEDKVKKPVKTKETKDVKALDFASLSKETEEVIKCLVKPVEGAGMIGVKWESFDGTTGGNELISLSGLEEFCHAHSLDFNAVSQIVGRPWVNHDGYTFEELYTEEVVLASEQGQGTL